MKFFFPGKIKFGTHFFGIVFLAGFAPPLFWLVQATFDGDLTSSDQWTKLGRGAIYSVIYTMLISTAVANVWNLIDRKYPWQEGAARRIAVQLTVTTLVACSTMTLLTLIDFYVIRTFCPEGFLGLFARNILTTLIMNVFITFTFEAIFFFRSWRETELEKERLEKENILSQFDSLKNQVNPHFLFNSLNVLSELVHIDPEKAEDFIADFSKVYRYVLEVKDQQLVSLKQEVDFIRSYLHLHQIRFGQNLQTEMHIPAEELHSLVPPLTLEILVENAIKHNQISARKPLHITLAVEDDMLMIRNNLQPRLEEVASTGVGLSNLRERYRHFAGQEPQFTTTEYEYIARVPLLKPELA